MENTTNQISVTTTTAKPWKFCPECGQSLQPEWKHCPQCGNGLIGSQVVVVPYYVPPYPVFIPWNPPYWSQPNITPLQPSWTTCGQLSRLIYGPDAQNINGGNLCLATQNEAISVQ